jgi:hypothetical protein
LTRIVVTMSVLNPAQLGFPGVTTMPRGSAAPSSDSATDSPLTRSIVIVVPPEHVAA